jgi:acetyl-CoA carboxylase alpha subunit
MNPPELLKLGIIDGIIPEPKGGAHRDWTTAAAQIRSAIDKTLGEMTKDAKASNGKKSAKKSATAAAPRNFMMERTVKFRAMGQAALAHAPGSSG